MNLVLTQCQMYRILQFRRAEKFFAQLQFVDRSDRGLEEASQTINAWLDPSVAGFNKE